MAEGRPKERDERGAARVATPRRTRRPTWRRSRGESTRREREACAKRHARGRRRSRATRRAGKARTRLILTAPLAAAALLCLPAAAQALEQKLTAADGAAGDTFGASVAVDGDTAVVGSLANDSGRGAVYVFARAGDRWAQTAKLTASDGAAGDGLGRSVAIDGDTIVAGAPGDDAGQGSAYTFARTCASACTQTAKLTAFTGAADEALGTSVAIDGDTIVAGAPDSFGMSPGPGSVYTFARTGGDRAETAKLTASDGAAGDSLGFSVAIDGEVIVAGAPVDEVGSNAQQGSAYTFAATGMDQTQTAKLTASDGAAGDGLGFSVAIDGDVIVAGAPIGNVARGWAYTFTRTGAAARTQTAKLTASDGAPGDALGVSVAIDGNAIVAGAPSPPSTLGTGPGSAYTFARTGPVARTETAKLTASDGAVGDGLGFSVAIDGDAIVAGAPFDQVGGNVGQGSASVFLPDSPAAPAPPPPPGVPPAGVPCPEGTSPTVICTRDPDGRLHYRGTDAAETFTGTEGDDVMVGEGGKDKMNARAGEDELRGGAGKDKLKGGGGRDKLKGGAGKDALKGNGGRDRLSGQGGKDRLKGGGGKDRLRGGKGKDKLKGQGGKDRIKGNSGRDRFAGGGGNDRINSKGQKREKVGCGGGKKDRVKNAKGDQVKRSCERVKR